MRFNSSVNKDYVKKENSFVIIINISQTRTKSKIPHCTFLAKIMQKCVQFSMSYGRRRFLFYFLRKMFRLCAFVRNSVLKCPRYMIETL